MEKVSPTCQQKLTSGVATSTVIMIMNGAFSVSGGANLCLKSRESLPKFVLKRGSKFAFCWRKVQLFC